jgi:mono/diheme cytochrome c family protein
MRDKLVLARTDVKDMVAFIRAFKGGMQVVSATSSGSTASATDMAQVLVPSSPTTPAPSPLSRPTAVAAPAPTTTTSLPAAPPTLIHVTAAPVVTTPAITSVAARPTALPVATMNSAARAEKLRMAGGIFNTNCIPCHGPDGRGTFVRPAMPPIPDFTSRDWQTSRSSSQLASSILEGKGTLMPSWNGKVTPAQARDLVLYVRSFGGPAMFAVGPEGEARAGLSLVEFSKRIRALRQQFDELEKAAQTLPAPASR